ncbi:MAG: hypothetical protein A2Z78_01445 [Candidatus Nealsonbacteria bacterium RBG_13_36_15]|uniref:Ferredoxin n=1 Tax=Candidatus Nealsonbacteria bacterium RBG_13_36_15 TaxID=1801660 RepID=A0A1G2DWB5_9BACT|nr:MAG: hypothetical protein A2Z78_01445 [Candidatus Nealsonbacteria bacterium RBG_13_36_15]
MAKIIQEREKCIGCGSCVALCPKFWEMGEDGKSSLKGGKQNSEGNCELETKEIGCNQEAADSCPVQIIQVIKE